MDSSIYDIAIIGGGINGCGIARDAAGRGLRVLLAEQGDLAGATSSASTKLIHGGLRYLEHYKFSLVRDSLREREVLWSMAPHIIAPLRFVLPHNRDLRPAWMIRLGLFLYDHLGGRKNLPPCHSVDLRNDAVGAPLRNSLTRGFEYSDCWVDDARLVVLNAMDAAQHGADINVCTQVVSARREGKLWRLSLRNMHNGIEKTAYAHTLVNAAGPWVSDVVTRCSDVSTRATIRLVKGSHIVVPRLFEHDRAYIFQNADQRIIFAIPYEDAYTLIGTTDVDYTGDPACVEASDEEIEYLCAAASEYFIDPIEPTAVVWSFSGVRPLYDEGASKAQEATRDYVLKLDCNEGGPALLNIFGGKITTYRRLAEESLSMLHAHLPECGAAWTRGAPLPGGDFSIDGRQALADQLRLEFPALDMKFAARLTRSYGTRAREILHGVRTRDDLGIHFGADLYEREVTYLMRNEWARTAEDILWRRTKLGLRLSRDEQAALGQWLETSANIDAKSNTGTA